MNSDQKRVLREREEEVRILMADHGCTQSEAINHLLRGTIIYDSADEMFDSWKECGVYNGETADDVRKYKVRDVSAVTYNGKEYFVEYCL